MPKYNTRFENLVVDTNQIKHKKRLKLKGHFGIRAFLAMMYCLFIGFIFEQHFRLGSRIKMHTGTIFSVVYWSISATTKE